jgi:hypothetical protein
MASPETSASPPLPDSAPPRAEILPAKVVRSSDQTTTSPPLPLCPASALIVVAVSIVVDSARCSSPLPCRPPPIWIVPPPVAPEASTVAPFSLIFRPETLI